MLPRVSKESDLTSINLLVSGLHDVVPHALVEALRERSDVALVTDEVIDERDLEDYLRKAPYPAQWSTQRLDDCPLYEIAPVDADPATVSAVLNWFAADRNANALRRAIKELDG